MQRQWHNEMHKTYNVANKGALQVNCVY